MMSIVTRAAAAALALLSVALAFLACAPREGPLPRALLPCDDAAPLVGGTSDATAVYTIDLRAGADASAANARLEDACGFTGVPASSGVPRITARLDLVQLGCVRCDPEVISVEVVIVDYPV